MADKDKVFVKMGTIVDGVDNQTLRTARKIKTSMANIRTIVQLDKKMNEERQIYRDSLNDYILQNGNGQGDQKRINVQDPVERMKFAEAILELREQETSIEKLSDPIFTEEFLEEKGVELDADEVIIFNQLGITDIDLGLDEEDTAEAEQAAVDKEIGLEEEVPEE